MAKRKKKKEEKVESINIDETEANAIEEEVVNIETALNTLTENLQTNLEMVKGVLIDASNTVSYVKKLNLEAKSKEKFIGIMAARIKEQEDVYAKTTERQRKEVADGQEKVVQAQKETDSQLKAMRATATKLITAIHKDVADEEAKVESAIKQHKQRESAARSKAIQAENDYKNFKESMA